MGPTVRTVRSAVACHRNLCHVLYVDIGLCPGPELASLPRLQALRGYIRQRAHCDSSRHHGRYIRRTPDEGTRNGGFHGSESDSFYDKATTINTTLARSACADRL